MSTCNKLDFSSKMCYGRYMAFCWYNFYIDIKKYMWQTLINSYYTGMETSNRYKIHMLHLMPH